MAVIAPQTNLKLLKNPLELSDANQINFASKSAQYNYFNSLPKWEVEEFKYMRQDAAIRFPAEMDEILQYNYVMYQNEAYSDKWFYAYIRKVNYVNDGMTEIVIEQDVFQNWQFDMQLKQSFVEREHVNDDTVGLNTVPESIGYGEEYVINSKSDYQYISRNLTDYYVAVQVSELVSRFNDYETGIYNGVPSGCYYIGLKMDDEFTSNIKNLVYCYDKLGKSDAIMAMFIVPKAFFPNVIELDYLVLDDKGEEIGGFTGFYFPHVAAPYTGENKTWTRNSTIDGYSPKNAKVLTYPYNYLLLSNNGGQDVVFKWEDFNDAYTAEFKLRGITSQGCQIKLIPLNYKGSADSYMHSIDAQKLPVVSWNSNFYLNWVAQNGTNLEIQTALSGVNFASNVIGGMLSGNIGQMVGAIPSLVSDVSSIAQANKVAQLVPDQARGNSNSGDINFAYNKSGFTGYQMCIKAEYARIVDEYFSAFGYKVNRIKVPNLTGRQNWNFVKTVGCELHGLFPQDDADKLKTMFNAGLTIWHNPNTFLDYSQNNNII